QPPSSAPQLELAPLRDRRMAMAMEAEMGTELDRDTFQSAPPAERLLSSSVRQPRPALPPWRRQREKETGMGTETDIFQSAALAEQRLPSSAPRLPSALPLVPG